MTWRRSTRAVALVTWLGALGTGQCVKVGPSYFAFYAPQETQLTLVGPTRVDLIVPGFSDRGSLVVTLDGVDVSDAFRFRERVARSELDLEAGEHELRATIDLTPALLGSAETVRRFEAIALQDPERCEILNDTECVLPFPSSRFQAEDESTDTGLRQSYPEGALPAISAGSLANLLAGDPFPLASAPFNRHDGVSPTVQPIAHFPGGVDLAASGASRLLESTRNFDLGSLDADSPSVLLDAVTGLRVAHFLENDANATGDFLDRQTTVMRPALSLLPGRRYIVAFRNLVAPGGGAVAAEAAFAALRDGRPSDIPALEARRARYEERIFPALAAAGVAREELVLAFDFTVASDRDLAGQMLAMRDEALAWVAGLDPLDRFAITSVETVSDCSQPGDTAWRDIRGTFRVPSYLTSDPAAEPPPLADNYANEDTLGFLAVNADGTPRRTGTVDAPFGITIPCVALDAPLTGLVLGHGLFGEGPGFARSFVESVSGLGELIDAGLVPADTRLDYVPAATNWSGLSQLEVPPLPSDIPEDPLSDPEFLMALGELLTSFIGKIFVDFDDFAALSDRMRQGQLATLVLARLVANGTFNEHACFQVLDPEPADCTVAAGDPAAGVFDTARTPVYFGASLGGIMGSMFLALTQDVQRGNVDVPAINFSLVLQRAKPFKPFKFFLDAIDPDPLPQIVGLQLLHELWVRGESACCVHHVTGNTLAPFPDTPAKDVLMTVALYDQQVTRFGAQIAAATMGLPNLEGSVLTDLPLVPDAQGPVASAHVIYDTGSYRLGVDDAFIPPLANLPVAQDDNRCDPHGLRAFIPASLTQLAGFLETGVIENSCNGLCDAAEPLEQPLGGPVCER